MFYEIIINSQLKNIFKNVMRIIGTCTSYVQLFSDRHYYSKNEFISNKYLNKINDKNLNEHLGHYYSDKYARHSGNKYLWNNIKTYSILKNHSKY